MRKILLVLIIVILLAFGITTAVNGTQIGNFRIYSVKEIAQQSEELDSKVQEINTLINSEYPTQVSNLDTASKEMKSTKEDYLKEINFSSNEELESVLQIKNFDIERIWAKVGNHAIDQGVNITISETKKSTTGARNLNFIVKGTYVAQTNFLYAIEDDPELDFRIYNYQLLPSEKAEEKELNILVATFNIKETVITRSLNDALNGYEYEVPTITDSIFNYPTDAVNGKKTNESGTGSATQTQPTDTQSTQTQSTDTQSTDTQPTQNPQ